MSFFPYNPKTARLGFLLGAVACAGLTAWALWGGTRGAETYGLARGGVSAGLMFAFLYALVRLRPRAGWGVEVDRLQIKVSRPMSSNPIEIPRAAVEMIRRDGKRQDTVVLYLSTGQRVVVSQHLFPSPAAFDQAARALSDFKPEDRNPEALH
ncbi:MAG: hypothetical protein M3Y59_00745 [Myxococcota bacterium]|nr:hypothetical protein [Myxococcota bacterium]